MSNKRPPTLKTIASLANVSIWTASYALKNHPSLPQKTCLRIQKIAKKIGYIPNPFASSLRKSSLEPSSFKGSLACLFGHQSFNPLDTTLKGFDPYHDAYHGAFSRAKELGYSMEPFWIYEPGMTTKRLDTIFQGRGISALMLFFCKASEINLEWKKYYCIDAAHTSLPSTFNFTYCDRYELTRLTLEKLNAMGYQRIGLVLGEQTDFHFKSRHRAAHFFMQENLPRSHRIPPLMITRETSHKREKNQILTWIKKYKLDVVMYSSSNAPKSIIEAGIKIPQEIGLVSLDIKTKAEFHISGMRIPYESFGAKAVDMLVGQIYRNEKGIPKNPTGMYVNPIWNKGTTLLKKK